MTPQAQLETFLKKFTPDVAAEARASLKRMRKLVPGAIEMVYDNYNALVIGFGPSERASEAVLSIAVLPQWVSVCFLQCGPKLNDPQRLLRGSGNRARHIRLTSAADLDTRPVHDLVNEALDRATVPIDTSARRRLIIKSISAKQRARRPRNH